MPAAPLLLTADGRRSLMDHYCSTLLDNVIPFWLRHGMDRECGGILTCLDRDGSILDTDKSVWFQGRAAWMFATLCNTVECRPEWREAAESCLNFAQRHCFSPEGKMYFSVTRDGRPLRMRRYVFSESFFAIAAAAVCRATGDAAAGEAARRAFATFLHHSFTPGVMPPKFSGTRPMKSVAPLMIGIATAQELRANLGDIEVTGKTCTAWIDAFAGEIEAHFFKPDLGVLLENVGPDGEIIDHADGRLLNPGHALECAWFLMHEGRLRDNRNQIQLGLRILDGMWPRGWDAEHGGLFYFRDLHGKPVQEYWQDMKFWWPHNEAIIATLLAWKLSGDEKYAQWHQAVHDWSFAHFPDREFGEWFGYLHRDGTVAQPAKGNLFKGPFHLPRMLWYCWRELAAPDTLTIRR